MTDKDITKYLFISPSDPNEPHKTIVVGPCKNGLPCKHCLSFDNGQKFSPQYGHDIYVLIKDIFIDKTKSNPKFQHLHGMFQANTLLKYKPFKPITPPITSPHNDTSV